MLSSKLKILWSKLRRISDPQGNCSDMTRSLTPQQAAGGALAAGLTITKLPPEGGDEAERRFFSAKGEMAQILNRPHECYRHLVYWDLDTPRSGQERGHHYHGRKVEFFYVLSGSLELMLKDLGTGETMTVPVEAGERISIQPNVAHAFRSRTYSQVLEYSPDPYDPTDTHPYKIEL